jgi:hypothetical protein
MGRNKLDKFDAAISHPGKAGVRGRARDGAPKMSAAAGAEKNRIKGETARPGAEKSRANFKVYFATTPEARGCWRRLFLRE